MNNARPPNRLAVAYYGKDILSFWLQRQVPSRLNNETGDPDAQAI